MGTLRLSSTIQICSMRVKDKDKVDHFNNILRKAS